MARVSGFVRARPAAPTCTRRPRDGRAARMVGAHRARRTAGEGTRRDDLEAGGL